MMSLVMAVLSGCGGGGGDGGDTTKPIFSSSATVTVAENQTSAITLKATDTNTVTYGIKDGDADSFAINVNTGVVTFKDAPDYETKTSYSFKATATDTAGNEATQDVTITISDLDDGQLKKTGQTQIYDADGDTVDRSTADDNASLRDDGYYQTGVEPSYTRDDAKQIVTDHITGLEWQDDEDANTTRKRWLTQENYDKCTGSNGQTQDTTKCNDTSGDTAATYCTTLSLDGGGWRLPTIDELMYIADRSKRNPAIDPTFQHTASDLYWSFTTIVGYEGYAWGVYFYGGHVNWLGKYRSLYVRCVRARQ